MPRPETVIGGEPLRGVFSPARQFAGARKGCARFRRILSLDPHQAEALTRKAIELALAGDLIALRLCLDRILPPRRERPTTFALPELRSAGDAGAAMAAILTAVASGNTCSGEAAELAKLVDAFVRATEATEKFERDHKFDALVPMLDYGGPRRG
jgi:hypothetical protein